MRRCRPAPTLLAVGGLLLNPATTLSQAQTREVSRFQQPTEERSIAAPEDGDPIARRAIPEAGPEDIEESIYLRERPDNLGEAARAFESRVLTRLLERREELVRVRRREAIGLLEQFISREPEDAVEMPDALLRLAELKWEKARVDYLQAFAAWQQVPEGNRGPQPQPAYAAPMSLYDRILNRHPDFDRTDLVLYMKAYALIELQRAEEALDVYRRILAEFGDSRFRPDAHMALAESQFSGSFDYPAALAEYENVLRYPESGLYDVALFKSAWCLWRMNRSQEAATRFRQVLDLGRGRENLTARQRRRLRELQDEALDYLIQVFTEDEGNTARDVFAFLEEIGGEEYAYQILERLSDTYIGQSRYEQGIEAYELLLEMNPSSEDAPNWQREIAAGYALLEDEAKTVAALTALAENYSDDSEWAHQQGDPEVVSRAARIAERTVRRQALVWHEEGQEGNEVPKLENAAGLYGVYLEYFDESDAAYEIEFYRAEILFHRLERFDEAGDAYLGAARRKPQGQLTRDALYNAIGAFERVREGELEECAGPRPPGPRPPGARPRSERPRNRRRRRSEEEAPAPNGDHRCEETDNDRKFSEAISLYVELYPNDPDLPEILFRQGRLYYDRGIYDPAVRLFGQLLERFPDSEYANPAGELILDSFNRAADYQNIETWARRLKEAPAFASAESQRRLDTLILQSVFKTGEQLASRGAHAEAADAYFRAAEEFPQDPRAKEAYFNAGVERQQAGDLAGAVLAYDRLVDRFAGDSVAADGCWRAAQMYESIAQFSDAARYYETYAERFPEGEKVRDALYNSVLLRVTAGDSRAATRNGRAFLERFPRHDSTDEVTFFIGRAQESAEQWDDAATTYRRFLRSTRNLDLKVEATTRLAQVLLAAGNTQGANRALADAVQLGRRNRSRLEQGLYYAAQARYLQGDQVLARYEAIQVAGDTDGLRRRLEQKAELLQEAALIYADVVDFEVAQFVTAALYQIGRSYELFAEGLREQPIPEDLSEEEEMAYQEQLAMFVIPMEDRAIQAYEGGYQKALELRIFNRWTAQLYEALSRLNDVQFPPLREAGGEIVEHAPIPRPEPLNELRRGEAGGEAADSNDEDSDAEEDS